MIEKITLSSTATCFPSQPAVLTADLKPSKKELLLEQSIGYIGVPIMYSTNSTRDVMCVPREPINKAFALQNSTRHNSYVLKSTELNG